MIPYVVGKLAPNSSHLTRGLVKFVPVGTIFVPFPPKTGTNMLHPLPPPIVTTQDGTAKPISRRETNFSDANGDKDLFVFPCFFFPCPADHEQNWQPYPVDTYSAICNDDT